MAAQSDGGAQIVAGYEVDSERQRERREQRRENRELGWQVDVELPDEVAVGASTAVSIRVRDASGRPVTGLEGRVDLYSPARADPVDEAMLVPARGASGRYRAQFRFRRAGLWDFVVRLDSDEHDYVERIRENF